MKQRITVKQLNELSWDQEHELKEWWNPEKHDLFIQGRRTIPLLVKEVNKKGEIWAGQKAQKWGEKPRKVYVDGLPLLTIGQCIQILIEKGNYKFDYSADCGELIDSLWEAVKVALLPEPEIDDEWDDCDDDFDEDDLDEIEDYDYYDEEAL